MPAITSGSLCHGAGASLVDLTASTTLVLLFKRPLAGQGKQRLAAGLGVESACYLAEGFLGCALEDLHDWPGPVILAPSDSADAGWAAELLPGAVVLSQAGGNLGQRLVSLDQQLRQQGHQRLVYIGSDAPALTPRHYREVMTALNQAEIERNARSPTELNPTVVVLSAAGDGGVTLMANSQPWPAELTALPWSTDTLGQALAECCQRNGLQVSYIEPCYDIDFEQDLARLRRDLAQDPRPARQALYRRLQSLTEPGVQPTTATASL